MSPVVETTAGCVVGATVGGVRAFLGIPYAADTAGPRRFRPPEPVDPWVGVKDATAFGGPCPQVAANTRWSPVIEEIRRVSGGAAPATEDMLKLNLWTPASDGPPRPVMVWLHGGNHDRGSASMRLTDGAALAAHGDVVVVSFNHRVGVLGYLFGNAGLLDIVAALSWVQENVERFGGDADNVTIFGLSGGGAKVADLLAMPAAAGLFHKAIAQSGIDLWAREPDAAERLRDAVLHSLDADPRSVPVEHLLHAAQRLSGVGSFSPVLEDATLPEHPYLAVRSCSAADVPLIVGATRDEATLLLRHDESTGSLHHDDQWARLQASLGPRRDRIVDRYTAARPAATETELFTAITSDRIRVPGTWLADARVECGGAPTYVYQVAFRHPVADGAFGAVHGVDLPLVFGTYQLLPSMASSTGAAAVSAQMRRAWGDFARTGTPGGWPPYDLRDRPTMVFDEVPTVEDDPLGEERRAWEPGDLGEECGLLSRHG